jgi:hypothetical protein
VDAEDFIADNRGNGEQIKDILAPLWKSELQY